MAICIGSETLIFVGSRTLICADFDFDTIGLDANCPKVICVRRNFYTICVACGPWIDTSGARLSKQSILKRDICVGLRTICDAKEWICVGLNVITDTKWSMLFKKKKENWRRMEWVYPTVNWPILLKKDLGRIAWV